MYSQRKLGLYSGAAVCMGLIVATSCLVSLGQGFGLAGKSFIIALIIAAILNAFVALSFSELNYMMPNVTGGLGQYMLVGLGPWASIVSNLSAYVLTTIFALSVELAMTGIVLHGLIPQVSPVVFSVAVVMILFGLNLLGIDIFSKVQNFTVALLIGSMAIMGLIGIMGWGSGTPVAPAEVVPEMTSLGDVVSLTAIAFWLFIGVEFIIPVSKELKNPRRNVILSMVLALAILLVIQSVLGSAMTMYVGTADMMSAEMPHILYSSRLLGEFGHVWMSIVTILAAVSTANTVLPTVGRILQGMADEGMMPRVFRKTNGYDSPWVGMSLMVLCILTMILSGYVTSSGLINMILAGSCFWLASYVLTHINVLVLRRRYPDAARNKKLMFWGIPQILGIVGCLYMIWNISGDMPSRMMIYKIFGILFVLASIYAYAWVNLVLKTKMFEPTLLGKMDIDPIPTKPLA
ncbi:MAG: APC family permease [Deltaproteobacteria bacterium]|jgi:amino acid transporter|nr:APC family permease [Deltaproteobacteria bacterium]